MKIHTRIFGLLFLLFLASPLRAQNPAPDKELKNDARTAATAERLLSRIRAVLPQGWSASYQRETGLLEVSRDEAVLAFPMATATPPPDEKPEKPELQPYAFAFRVTAAIDEAGYARLCVENAKIREKAAVFSKKLDAMHVPNMGHYSPRTDEEKAIFAQYEALIHSLLKPPDFYFKNISLGWERNSPDYPVTIPADNHIREECEQVRDKVVHLFSRYVVD